MFYLLLMFSLVTLGAGVFLIGFGLPIRETVFGSALLVSATVALVGTFLLVGLAVAVRELQRVVHGVRRMPGPRPPRPADRKEGERRPPSQRPASHRASAEAPIPPPTSIDEPPYGGHEHESHGATGCPRRQPRAVRGEPRTEARAQPAGAGAAAGAGMAAPRHLRNRVAPGRAGTAGAARSPSPGPAPSRRTARVAMGQATFRSAGPVPRRPERPAVQEGWLRPRAGVAGSRSSLRIMRPSRICGCVRDMPPAAQLETAPPPAPPYEREPEPLAGFSDAATDAARSPARADAAL